MFALLLNLNIHNSLVKAFSLAIHLSDNNPHALKEFFICLKKVQLISFERGRESFP